MISNTQDQSILFKSANLPKSSIKDKKEQADKEKEISRLYKKVGHLTMERDFLKKVLDA